MWYGIFVFLATTRPGLVHGVAAGNTCASIMFIIFFNFVLFIMIVFQWRSNLFLGFAN